MRDGVTVGVSREGALARPLEAREPERALAAECVHIGADADAKLGRARGVERHGRRGTKLGRDERACPLEIGRRRDLEGALVALDRRHGVTGGLNEARFIGELFADVRCALRGGDEDAAGKALRCLRAHEFRPVDAAGRAGGRTPFEGVDDGQHGQCADARGAHRVGDPHEHLGRGQGARRVVNEHGFVAAPEGREPGADRSRSCRPARDDRDEVAAHAGAQGARSICGIRPRKSLGERIADKILGRNDDDVRDERREYAIEAVAEDRALVDADERLRGALTESRTRARRHDDDRGIGNGGQRSHAVTLSRERTRCVRTRAPRRARHRRALRRSSRRARARR